MLFVGLDIGTTTICGVAVDAQTGAVTDCAVRPNTSFLPASRPWEKLQDPAVILQTCREILSALTAKHTVSAIGLTGQMHGIVYTDAAGSAVGPLAIWQDGRGDQPYRDHKTYAQVLSEITGCPMATGFGLTTHFYNTINALVPGQAVCCCTIHDYVAARLTGLSRPVTHASDAASFGLFNVAAGAFELDKITAAGMDVRLLPEVVSGLTVIGRYEGIPVCAAVGDNQASFIGSVNDENAALINVGTGSQISVGAEVSAADGELETRPLTGGRNILVGCALCGGRAYALLQKFFGKVCEMATGTPCGELYDRMDAAAAGLSEASLEFTTTFSGTRRDPGKRAFIGNLGEDNFTPEQFIVGVLTGMTDELHAHYLSACRSGAKASVLVGSGNGIRKNPVLRRIIERRFGMPLLIPAHTEEAAFGAALCAMVASGTFPDLTAAQKIIRYLGEKEQ